MTKTSITFLNANNQVNTRLELQIGQLASGVNERGKGTFPANMCLIQEHQNLNRKTNQAHICQDDQVNQVIDNTTLRSGKHIDNHIVMHDQFAET